MAYAVLGNNFYNMMSRKTILALECLKIELDSWLHPEFGGGDAYELCKELRNVIDSLEKNEKVIL
jgi:hypothetical protein